jgi:hypothetical protein
MFCECIPLLNKNSLWIRFVKSISASQQSAITFGGYAQQKQKTISPQRREGHKEKFEKVCFLARMVRGLCRRREVTARLKCP